MGILRRSDYQRMPWKNGQGLTEEVRSFPPDSTMETFDWRLSIAHVGADGPFSQFPGIDRSIALLDGEGLILDLPDGETILHPQGEPFAFPGEWDVSSRNSSGGTMDLNIMTRRGRCVHRMVRHKLQAGDVLAASSQAVLVFNTKATIRADGTDVMLERFDCLMLSAGEAVTVAGKPVELLAVELTYA